VDTSGDMFTLMMVLCFLNW